MTEPTIQFPVSCPKCGREELGEYSVAEVAGRSSPLPRDCDCMHRATIIAGPRAAELAQIREYFREWMKSQPPSLQTEHQRE
jgi:hypothetical protein